jgi:hypothetical protein
VAIALKKGMITAGARPLQPASGMGGKETSGSAVPPPRTPRPPRAPVPHSFTLGWRESSIRKLEKRQLTEVFLAWEPLARFRTDAEYRTRVLDYLAVAGLAFVFALSAYLVSIRD